MESKIELKAALEALLFYAVEPIEIEELATVLNVKKEEIEILLEELTAEYRQDEERGNEIEYIAGGVMFSPKPLYSDYLKTMYSSKVQQRITQASLETLAIIAYRQPITRNEIEEIRGVKAEKALLTLLKRGLIGELGRLERTGSPILYGTTDMFLRYFKLNTIKDLPDPEGIRGEGAPNIYKDEDEDGDVDVERLP